MENKINKILNNLSTKWKKFSEKYPMIFESKENEGKLLNEIKLSSNNKGFPKNINWKYIVNNYEEFENILKKLFNLDYDFYGGKKERKSFEWFKNHFDDNNNIIYPLTIYSVNDILYIKLNKGDSSDSFKKLKFLELNEIKIKKLITEFPENINWKYEVNNQNELEVLFNYLEKKGWLLNNNEKPTNWKITSFGDYNNKYPFTLYHNISDGKKIWFRSKDMESADQTYGPFKKLNEIKIINSSNIIKLPSGYNYDNLGIEISKKSEEEVKDIIKDIINLNPVLKKYYEINIKSRSHEVDKCINNILKFLKFKLLIVKKNNFLSKIIYEVLATLIGSVDINKIEEELNNNNYFLSEDFVNKVTKNQKYKYYWYQQYLFNQKQNILKESLKPEYQEALDKIIKGFDLYPYPKGFANAYMTKKAKATPNLAKQINKFLHTKLKVTDIKFVYDPYYQTINLAWNKLEEIKLINSNNPISKLINLVNKVKEHYTQEDLDYFERVIKKGDLERIESLYNEIRKHFDDNFNLKEIKIISSNYNFNRNFDNNFDFNLKFEKGKNAIQNIQNCVKANPYISEKNIVNILVNKLRWYGNSSTGKAVKDFIRKANLNKIQVVNPNTKRKVFLYYIKNKNIQENQFSKEWWNKQLELDEIKIFGKNQFPKSLRWSYKINNEEEGKALRKKLINLGYKWPSQELIENDIYPNSIFTGLGHYPFPVYIGNCLEKDRNGIIWSTSIQNKNQDGDEYYKLNY